MKKLTAAVLAILMVAMAFTGCKKDENTLNIKSAEDLKGLKIGVQAGTTGQYYVEDEIEDAKLSQFKSGMDAALDLKSGQLDVVIIDELPAKAIVAQNDDLKILDIELTSEEYAIAVKKGNTELLEKMNAAIKKMKDDGTYDKLNEAFITADGTVTLPDAIETSGDVIKMGTNAAFPPFEYVEGTEIVGFDVSMAQYVAKELGMKLEIVNMEFDSLLSALSSGAVDFVAAGMTIREDRLEYADFTDTYYATTQVAIVKK